MTTMANASPGKFTLLEQQLALLLSSLQRESKALGMGLVLLVIYALLGGLGREPLTAEPNILLFALPIAAFLPIAVWRGEQPFEQSALWALPVRRQDNALARGAAGAIWLLGAMLIMLAVLALIAWGSGGGIGVSELRLVSPNGEIANPVYQHWVTPAWEYAVPFTAALIVYTAASAALLGLRHPLRWIFGTTVVVAILLALALQNLPGTPLTSMLEIIRYNLWLGDYGLDHALSGGMTGLRHDHLTPDRQTQVIWSSLPTITAWLRSTLIWMTVSVLLMALALWRHAET